jgi:predicted N-acetyltransferase YhbS
MAGLTPPRPLAAADERSGFDCGRASLNVWFRRHALRNQQSGASRTNIICDAEGGAIAGFVSLSAAQIARAWVAKPDQRNRPDPLPAILLGQLAVDQRYQNRGCARSLLLFALATSLRMSREIGCFGVLVYPLDDAVRAFYARFGFETLPGDPQGHMIVRMADLERSGF